MCSAVSLPLLTCYVAVVLPLVWACLPIMTSLCVEPFSKLELRKHELRLPSRSSGTMERSAKAARTAQAFTDLVAELEADPVFGGGTSGAARSSVAATSGAARSSAAASSGAARSSAAASSSAAGSSSAAATELQWDPISELVVPSSVLAAGDALADIARFGAPRTPPVPPASRPPISPGSPTESPSAADADPYQVEVEVPVEAQAPQSAEVAMRPAGYDMRVASNTLGRSWNLSEEEVRNLRWEELTARTANVSWQDRGPAPGPAGQEVNNWRGQAWREGVNGGPPRLSVSKCFTRRHEMI